jgi:putative tryptophan/tyrosine transport system substrate-binding protein
MRAYESRCLPDRALNGLEHFSETNERTIRPQRSLRLRYLSAEGRGERFPALAAECLRLKADIIAVSTTPAAEAAKNATRTIPIIMIALGDPVGTGLVDSLAQPGGNATGMSLMVSELAAKRLNLLTEAVPGISRVLVLAYLDDPIAVM